MTSHRDNVDAAIDQVAAHMTRVEPDDLLAARIVAALPERRSSIGPLAWRVAALAAVAIVSLGVLRRGDGAGPVPRPVLASATAIVVSAFVPAASRHSSSAENGLSPVAVLPAIGVDDGSADHERSLPALALSALPTDSLPEDGSLSVESLSIADLALASELLSPIEE